MIVCGIDPGLKGALALYDGVTMRIEDIPVLPARKGGKVRREIDGYELARIIDAAGHIDHAAIELVGAIGRKKKPDGTIVPGDGVVGAFAFGAAFGDIRGTLRAHFIPIKFPPPRVWRKAMGVPPSIKGDKQPAIARATALLPRESSAWAAVRGNGDAATRSGRAEAALIALWLWQQIKQEAA